MKNKQIKTIIVTLLMVASVFVMAACGAGEALVEKGVEEALDRTVGEGTLATVEAAATEVVEGAADTQEALDVDNDGEVSQSEIEAAIAAPGGNPTNPLDVELGTMVTDRVLQGAFGRHYRVSLSDGAITTIQATNTGDVDLIFAIGGLPSNIDIPDMLPKGETFETTFILGEGRDATVSFLTVFGTSDFEFMVSAENQNDAGTGADASGDTDSATDIEAGTGLPGMFGQGDTKDAYRIRVPALTAAEISLTNADDTKDPIVLHTQTTNGYYESSDPILPGNSALIVLSETSEYFVTFEVRGETSGGSYTLDVVYINEDDAGTGEDITDVVGSAQPVGFGETVAGRSLAGDQDCYKVTLPAGQALTVDVMSPAEQVYETYAKIEVYDSAGDYLGTTTADYGATSTYEYGLVSYETATEGDYSICIFANDYYPLGDYQFTANAITPSE